MESPYQIRVEASGRSLACYYIQTGGNIVLVGHDEEKEEQVIQAHRDAVSSGPISAETLDERVHHVLGLEQKYSLTNDLAQEPDTKQFNEEIHHILEPYVL